MTRNSTSRDHHVHQRPGDRDDQFLRRLFRNALQPRHAADRQQRDVGRLDAVAPRREDVAELVQQHADEQQHDEETPSIAASGPPCA